MRFNKLVFAILALAALSLSGCSLMTSSSGVTTGKGDVSTADMQTFQQVFMSSYYANSGGSPAVGRALTPFIASAEPQSGSRATIPVNTPSLLWSTNFAAMISTPANNKILNYPQTGQTTTFSVVKVNTAPDVYDITATTAFPANDTRSTYVEEYYVEDVGLFGGFYSAAHPDTTWDINDPIVQVPAAPVPNQNARKKLLLTFRDGTTRSETIVSSTDYASGVPKFVPFDINGSLDLSQNFVPAMNGTNVNYSSVVVYETHPAVNPNFWFWSGSMAQTIVGIRYYTEQTNGASLTGSSISFEKTVSVNTTIGGTMAATLNVVAGGTQWNTLAESVLREQIVWPTVTGVPVLSMANVTKNMQTRVINIGTLKDFYITQLNADFATLSNFSSGTQYVPVGVVDPVLATDSTALLFNRNQVTTGVNGALPLATQTVDTVGLGTMAQVYAAIVEGALANTVTAATPGSNVMPGLSWSFNGQQSAGSSIPSSTNYQCGQQGTVEAWVYLTALTDTMGIVHYGSNTNFTDEAYSLQGWGSNGQIGMIVDGAGGNYDSVLSKRLLGTGQWYYLVGVWDTSIGSNSYIKLYINGVLDNTKTSLAAAILPAGSQAATEPVPSPQILVGSQLPSSYSAQYGYFGLKGKIVGVNISKTTTPAINILNTYNTYKGNTAGW